VKTVAIPGYTARKSIKSAESYAGNGADALDPLEARFRDILLKDVKNKSAGTYALWNLQLRDLEYVPR